jgi:hypothetical protein
MLSPFVMLVKDQSSISYLILFSLNLFFQIIEILPQTLLVAKKYYVLFIDDFRKYTWVYLLKDKSDVCFRIFKISWSNSLIKRFGPCRPTASL